MTSSTSTPCTSGSCTSSCGSGSRPARWKRRTCWCPSRSISAPAEAAAALENQELLAQLGMKVEPFGGDTVLVTGFPAMLANIEPRRGVARAGGAAAVRRQSSPTAATARRAVAHDRLQGGDQGRRPAGAGRDRRAAWSSGTWSTTPIIVRTAGPRRWSSPARSWTSSSSGFKMIGIGVGD